MSLASITRRDVPMHHRSALITGASSGIGAAFADVLPAGTNLVLVGRDKDRLNAIAARRAGTDRKIETVVADLTTDAGREAVIARAEAAEIDLLINNAGVGLLGGFLEHDPAAERAVIELNVTTPVVLARALLPGMLKRARESGRQAGLILLSSQAAFAPVPFFTTYAASKAFNLLLGEGLAEELAEEPVDVLTVCPGATRTNFGHRAGFSPGNLPLAAAPKSVAREALGMLGKRTVLISGKLNRAGFLPVTLPRKIAAQTFGRVVGWTVRRQGGHS